MNPRECYLPEGPLALGVALLRGGRWVAVCGLLLAAAVFGIAACAAGHGPARAVIGAAGVVLFLAQAYYAMRVETDLAVFERLRAFVGPLDEALREFDASLEALRLAGRRRPGRPIGERVAGVKRIVMSQALLAAASGVFAVCSLIVL